MNLNFYDILTILIPGVLVYFVGTYLLSIDINNINSVILISLSYIIGYFINLLGSWLETILFLSWGGQPSEELLKGNNCGKIKFYEYEEIIKLIKKYKKDNNLSYGFIFNVGTRIANDEGRIKDMNGHYAFSRSILTSILISVFLLGFKYYIYWHFWILGLGLIIISWYRTKERGYYYAKEVLVVALNKLKEKK